MKSMRVGWMLFGPYCKMRGIDQNGHHSRKLEKLDGAFKENLSPDASRATWAVNVNEADKVFGVNKDEKTKKWS